MEIQSIIRLARHTHMLCPDGKFHQAFLHNSPAIKLRNNIDTVKSLVSSMNEQVSKCFDLYEQRDAVCLNLSALFYASNAALGSMSLLILNS
jgi:hypothetical protein